MDIVRVCILSNWSLLARYVVVTPSTKGVTANTRKKCVDNGAAARGVITHS